MSRIDKLKSRFLAEPIPTDFRWEDLVTLLGHLGFSLKPSSGSGRKFVFESKPELVIFIHEPHPQKTLKTYQVREIRQTLRDNDLSL